MDPTLLTNPKLLFVVCMSAVVSMLGSITVAARPAAVATQRVATASTISSLVLLVTRLANLFYLPLLATFAGEAIRTGDTDTFKARLVWVVLGGTAGNAVAWLFLPRFVSLYKVLVERIYQGGTKSLARPEVIKEAVASLARPSELKARFGQLHGLPAGFLFWNVFATAVWIAGPLCSLFVGALHPEHKITAALLSGLVNGFAAIAFSVFVDPQAAVIVDQSVPNKQGDPPSRKPEQADTLALHLAAGNCLGSLLGVLVIPLGVPLVLAATGFMSRLGGQASEDLWSVVLLNAGITLLSCTTYAARVSAVKTGRVAMALAVYNLFFLVTRLSGQFYAPLLGAVAEHFKLLGQPEQMIYGFRCILAGASLGALVGLLLMPTFVEIYNRAVTQLEKRGTMHSVLLGCLHPSAWPVMFGCLRPPGIVRMGDQPSGWRRLPKAFLIGNMLVVAIYTIGQMAAIVAGTQVAADAAQSAALLSSVVNGLATITLALIVDPTLAAITDGCVKGERPAGQIAAAASLLMVTFLLGTLLSQVLFVPAAHFIGATAELLARWR